ncbi:MAG: hypothetical protein IPP48_15665 [Chitinophagaceae bacterium]|nr:hypothetical protein [Chitinophagaceae bacterium]
MTKNKLTVVTLAILLLLCFFLWMKKSSLLWKVASDDFRNIKLNGKVVDKIINKELHEKTHTIVFSDSSRYVLPNKDLDNSIEVGDSIYKIQNDYKIIIYKAAKLNNKIVFVLPYAE